MSKALAGHNGTDARLMNAELFGQFALCDVALGPGKPDGAHSVGRQLGPFVTPVMCAARLASFTAAISVIVGAGAKEDVCGIDTQFVVTSVASHQSGGDGALR